VPKESRELVKHSAIMAEAAKDLALKERTLTNLYNQRPAWLRLAHEKLDHAVLAAYAVVDPDAPHRWNPDWAAAYEPFGAGEIVVRDAAWKRAGGKGKPDAPEVAEAKRAALAMRADVDQKILANLLRLNHERAVGGGDDLGRQEKAVRPGGDARTTQSEGRGGVSRGGGPRSGLVSRP